MKVALLALLFLLIGLPVTLRAQYVKYTKGYCNIYSEPNKKTEVIGRLKQFEILKGASSICGNDESYDSIPPSWMAVALYPSEKVGYIKRKEMRPLGGWTQSKDSESPKMESKRYPELTFVEDDGGRQFEHYETDADSVFFGNTQKGVLLAMEYCDSAKYIITRGSAHHLPTVNGRYILGGASLIGPVAMTDFSIFWKGKRHRLPEEYIRQYFFANNFLKLEKFVNENGIDVRQNMHVEEGPKGEMYIWLWGGDASEGFCLLWVVRNGKLVAEFSDTAC